MSDAIRTAEDYFHASPSECQGEAEAVRLLRMIARIENQSPGEIRQQMFQILAEEMSTSVLCRHHWHEIERRLAAASRVPNILQ